MNHTGTSPRVGKFHIGRPAFDILELESVAIPIRFRTCLAILLGPAGLLVEAGSGVVGQLAEGYVVESSDASRMKSDTGDTMVLDTLR